MSGMLDEVLRGVARRYRLAGGGAGSGDVALAGDAAASTSNALALAIEQGRRALTSGVTAEADAGRQAFVGALAQLIREAMLPLADLATGDPAGGDPAAGDPVFQAMVLKQRSPAVREYAALAAQRASSRRAVQAVIDRHAHPARLAQAGGPAAHRACWQPVQQAAVQQRWRALHTALAALASGGARQNSDDSQDTSNSNTSNSNTSNSNTSNSNTSNTSNTDYPSNDNRAPAAAPCPADWIDLLHGPALQSLLRLDQLASQPSVLRYLDLVARQGPAAGSTAALAQGRSARRRGAAVETQVAAALQALAERLAGQGTDAAEYRVATSLRVPAAFPADFQRAKGEWDAMLLRRRRGADTPAWEVCLIAEAKASADAATTDFARLRRGIALLTLADPDTVYPFASQQGLVPLHGASLRALRTDPAALAATVIYASDAPADGPPRLLGAASRMQLLSASASLDYAAALHDDPQASAQRLAPLWDELLSAPRWRHVLNQYPTLEQLRALMVHVDDLHAAARKPLY